MSYTLKIFIKITLNQIIRKCEQGLQETQFKFRSSFGTGEALFVLNVFLQKCRNQIKDVSACFMNFEKAFDKYGIQNE